LEWVNLAHRSTPEIESIKKELQLYLPEYNAEEIPKAGADKSATKENDMTIKAKRNLADLE